MRTNTYLVLEPHDPLYRLMGELQALTPIPKYRRLSQRAMTERLGYESTIESFGRDENGYFKGEDIYLWGSHDLISYLQYMVMMILCEYCADEHTADMIPRVHHVMANLQDALFNLAETFYPTLEGYSDAPRP